MSKNLQRKPPGGRILLGAAALSLACLPALAQDTNEATVLKPTVVTGSYIPTAETVGVAPVDVVGSVTIQRVGSQDVLETLKRTTPIFGGNGNYGQSVNNSGRGEAYIAVRNLPTLVLLDGRRVVNSAFSSGSAVDVNTIPIAMIERIEVLKDGASALYGSDAIGGVVNIITKKNWNGAEIGGRYGFATGNGDVTENRAYVVGGTSTDKATFSAGAQYYYSDPLYAKDRKVASMGTEDLLDAGLFPPTYISGSYPGRVRSEGVSYILAGSPFAVGAPGYNPAITAPPVTPHTNFPTMSAYLAAHPGVYIPIASTPIGQALEAAYSRLGASGEAAGWPLINTAELGVPSIMGQDRRQFIANGSYELFGKRVELFSEFFYADTRSSAALAGAPMSSLDSANITIAADSPVNPFGIALGANGVSDPIIRSRFLDLGARQYEYSSDTYRFIGGLKGDFENGFTYETAFNYGRSKALTRMLNSPSGAALQLATTANTDDPALAALGYSQLYDAVGPVPLYNPFALPGGNDPRTIEAIRATGYESAVSELWGADGRVTGLVPGFDLPAGQIGWAAGAGFYRETLGSDVDGLTKLGQLIGQNPNNPMPDQFRDAYNVFVETRFPITSPDMDVAGAHSLELTAAGRFESFDPGGDSAVPKIGIRWQPFDEQLTLRASYSQSFLAPSVYQLYGAPATSFDPVSIAGSSRQVQMNWVSEPGLKPADAESYSAGFVFSPKAIPGLTVSADYYHIQTENDVYRVGAQAVVNSLNQFGSASEFASGFLFNDFSTRLTSTAPNQITVDNWGKADRPFRNGAEQETHGFDLSANYELPLDEAYGKVSVFAAANVILSYKYSDPLIGGPYEYAGQFTDQGPAGGSQGALPDFTLNTGLSWDFAGFTYTVNARYIPGIEDQGDAHESNYPDGGERFNNYTLSGGTWDVSDWYSIDMQLAYEFKNEGRWYNGTRIALGVNNVTDVDVPLIASSSEDNTDKTTYDILGRFVYVEVSKKF